MICVGTKRGRNYGIVYDASGRIIGRVYRHTQTAAGTRKRERHDFWTALPASPDGRTNVSGSLGTRHPDRRSAMAAVRAFALAYPADAIETRALNAPATYATYTTWFRYRGENLTAEEVWQRALAWATMRCAMDFKYDNWQACAIPAARYSPAPEHRKGTARRSG